MAMNMQESINLVHALAELRGELQKVFSDDTAAPGNNRATPSAGHCAAVAAIIHKRYGGQLVSAKVCGESHWFNRLDADGKSLDVDLTGDQFGKAGFQVWAAGALYPDSRVREASDLNEETRWRSSLLEQRLADAKCNVELEARSDAKKAVDGRRKGGR